MSKRQKGRTRRSGMLPLGDLARMTFRVMHACPATIHAEGEVGDWTPFQVVEDDTDLLVFECTKCDLNVCIDIETVAQKTRKGKP